MKKRKPTVGMQRHNSGSCVTSAPPLNASAAVTTLKKVYVVVQRNATKDQ